MAGIAGHFFAYSLNSYFASSPSDPAIARTVDIRDYLFGYTQGLDIYYIARRFFTRRNFDEFSLSQKYKNLEYHNLIDNFGDCSILFTICLRTDRQ